MQYVAIQLNSITSLYKISQRSIPRKTISWHSHNTPLKPKQLRSFSCNGTGWNAVEREIALTELATVKAAGIDLFSLFAYAPVIMAPVAFHSLNMWRCTFFRKRINERRRTRSILDHRITRTEFQFLLITGACLSARVVDANTSRFWASERERDWTKRKISNGSINGKRAFRSVERIRMMTVRSRFKIYLSELTRPRWRLISTLETGVFVQNVRPSRLSLVIARSTNDFYCRDPARNALMEAII